MVLVYTLILLTQDLILNLARKIEKMENTLMKVYNFIESLPESLTAGSGIRQHNVKSELAEDIVSGHAHYYSIFSLLFWNMHTSCIPYNLLIVVLLYFVQVNGINILRLSARDVYAFGLQLLDIFFTKEEQSRSLLFSSKKSSKPGLDRERVDRLLGECDICNCCTQTW